ncbi:hypothetical protein AB4427_17260 [Vibrio artabrorum]|uniref:hypothetical protein n=1 Tax=Vibrio artabrorum TaxID=446374 RepID=UPI003551BB95
MPIGKAAIKRYLPLILEDADNGLPDTFRQVISRLYEHLKELGEHIEQYDHLLNEHFKHCELSQRIASLPGIGLISATAIVGTIGDAYLRTLLIHGSGLCSHEGKTTTPNNTPMPLRVNLAQMACI